ncbi:MAG: hypothetical protein HDR72_00225 [Ruminococcaceae bacterium]|nr:hypothetical protein [Oscillospiraceae bacterium]
MADKNTANIGFEKQIWDAACVLWGHIPAAEYRKVIVGLIFLKRVLGDVVDLFSNMDMNDSYIKCYADIG